MEVLTNRPEFYQNNIDKYFANKKRWEFLSKLSRVFQYFSMVSIIAFYSFFAAYIFTKFTDGDYNLMFNMMIGVVIFGIVSVIILSLMEWKRFELNTRDKIWYSYIQAKEMGYHPETLSIWEESDKIHSHITFVNDEKDHREAYFRMDEFLIVFEDVQKPQINLDNYQIIMPKSKEGKMLHGMLDNE